MFSWLGLMSRRCVKSRFRRRIVALLLVVACFAAMPVRAADESLARYFEQLRRRGLYSLAESYALSRLTQTGLSAARRTDFTVEFSRTLAERAEFAPETQQQHLWKRAKSVVDEERQRDPSNPFDILLAVQSAMVPSVEADWLRTECDLRPFDEPLAERARLASTAAVKQLSAVEQELVSPPKDRGVEHPKSPTDGPSSHETRVLLHRVRLALGRSLRIRAELAAADSRSRSVDLMDAEQTVRKLVGVADEPIPFLAKLQLASCLRVKGDLKRAEDMLLVLEQDPVMIDPDLADQVAAERVRILLERHLAPDGLELILRARSKRKRLSGELWFLQVRSLTVMRDLAVQKKDDALAARLREQAEITLQRCDEQVGGFWARRCHQLWDAKQTSEKYGPGLDLAMQQARADFLAGRIDAALTGYAKAEQTALTSNQTDLAMDIGYTHASILLSEKQFEVASTEFLRLAREHPQHTRAAAAHLNGAYCLGRLYDEHKSQSRRVAYTESLDRQIELFANDPSADDARFFKAQLEEQRLQATAALPLYLQVSNGHPRAAEAHAGAARCYETILARLRERHLASGEFARTATDTLTRILAEQEKSQTSKISWTPAECEVALHLAAILLMTEPPGFDRAEPLLGRIVTTAAGIAEDDEQIERWKRLRQRADSLRVVALAGNGRPLDAERLIDSLAAASPRDLLVIVERLAPFVASADRQRQVQYVSLQLHAAERLSKFRDSLSKSEQDQLDQAVGRAYLASGQTPKALELYGKLATETSKDAKRQREIAILFKDSDQPDCQSLARQCWRRVEALSKQGTPEWLTARLGVIESNVRLHQSDEARKLMKITRLLYPELGGSELKPRFVEMERLLDQRRPSATADR
jgi:hypothetical protein